MDFPCFDSVRQDAGADDPGKVIVLFTASPVPPDPPPDGGSTCCAALGAATDRLAVLRSPDGRPSLYMIPAAGSRACRLSAAACNCDRAA